MFDTVREWLRKGKSEKVIGFCILFVSVYSILWGLVEPIISSDIIIELFPKASERWWIFQIGISVGLSVSIYFFLLPGKVLQTFGLESQDTKLNESISQSGNSKISIVADGYYGDVFKIEGDFSDDYCSWNVSPDADNANSLSYIYSPAGKFVLYLRLSVVSEGKTKQELKWLALRTDISLPIGNQESNEYAYPIKGNSAKNGWLISHINIPDAVTKTFGQKKWRYDKLIEIRIRGTGKIQKIILKAK